MKHLLTTLSFVLITISSVAQFKLNPPNTTICLNNTATIELGLFAGGKYSNGDPVDSTLHMIFVWGDDSKQDTITSIDKTTNIFTPISNELRDHKYEASGEFKMYTKLIHLNGLENYSDTVSFKRPFEPDLSNAKAFDYAGNEELDYLCSPDSIKLSVSSIEMDDSLKNNYTPVEWIGDSLRFVNNSTAYVRPAYDKDVDYILKVTDDLGCNYTHTITLKTLEAKASADPTSVQAGKEVQFTNETENTDIVKWYFYKYNKSDTVVTDSTQNINPTKTYTESDTLSKFMVKMVAYLESCVDTADQIDIKVLPSSIGEFPKAFSPNSGTNPTFKLKDEAISIESFKCIIFTKWGQEIYSWNDPNEGWDGSIDSNEAPAGVYFYHFEATGYDGKKTEKRGSFHMFR